MTEQITLTACESGYRVTVDGEWAGTLMRRLWEATGQSELDHWLVAPSNPDAKCLRHSTMGQALDYLLTTVAVAV